MQRFVTAMEYDFQESVCEQDVNQRPQPLKSERTHIQRIQFQ